MDYPLRCSCGHENWIDLDDPEAISFRPVGKVAYSEGYMCEACGAYIVFFISTRLLDELMKKLDNCKPNTPKFKYLFGKAVKNAIRIRVKYG